jgi:hypothetical protein
MNDQPLEPANLLVRAWRRTPEFVKWIGYGGTVFGFIIVTSQVAPIIEPYIVAHRAYARSVSRDDVTPLLRRLIKVQLAQNDTIRKRALKSVKDYELELQSDQAVKTPQYRKLIQEGIERAKSDLKDIDDDNTNLFKEQKEKK